MESHCVSDAIPENNDLVWVVTVHRPELVKCIFVHSIKVFLDNFLPFGLADDVLVKASAGRIGGGNEADDRVLACVADIHADDHDLRRGHECWQLDADRLTA